jgi:hypothetical protein
MCQILFTGELLMVAACFISTSLNLYILLFFSMQKHFGFIKSPSLLPLCNSFTYQLYCMQIVIYYRMCKNFVLHYVSKFMSNFKII